jgi:hypothetical protein
MRCLAILTVAALLTWAAGEGIAAGRPTIPELPSEISIDDDFAGTQTTDRVAGVAHPPQDLRAKIVAGSRARDGRQRTWSRPGTWHPTRHARDDSPDH